MPALPNELMGYDRAITVFSPDGRLLQVEYARRTVQQGTTAIGIVAKDGVALLADKRIIEKLIVPESIEKIFQIAGHIGAAASGLISDARVLIEKAQLDAQRHKMTYDEEIDTITLVKEICNDKQIFTQYAGTRPFGVSLLVAGIDSSGIKLFMTEPSGIFFEYKAAAIGEGSVIANKFFEKHYKDEIKLDEAVILGIKALKEVLGDKFLKERVEIALIHASDKKFIKLNKEEAEKYFSKV